MQTDWSRQGVGYLVLQKNCNCTLEKAPTRCNDGWNLVFAGSRFTNDAESRYSSSEGEALAVVWALNHSRMFTVGCKNLLVVTDHRPLLGIFADRDLHKILQTLVSADSKKSRYGFRFAIQYNPGKCNRSADAVSHWPTEGVPVVDGQDLDLLQAIHETAEEDMTMDEILGIYAEDRISAIYPAQGIENAVISLDKVQQTTQVDTSCQKLKGYITMVFPGTRMLCDAEVREYWSVIKDRLTITQDVIMLVSHILIPKELRKCVLQALHTEHQGVSGIKARANTTVYWPALNASIRLTRYNCQRCNETSPSLLREPLILTKSPDYPYQHVTVDFFNVKGYTYLVYVDRFTAWISLFHLPVNQATSARLMRNCRDMFHMYGVPEIMDSHGAAVYFVIIPTVFT